MAKPRTTTTLTEMPADTESQEIVQKWDADPIVVVSRRPRTLIFPQPLLAREASEQELAKWALGAVDKHGDPLRASDRQESTLTINAGITFLGSWTTCWKLLNVEDASKAPRDGRDRPLAPSYDSCVLVYPVTKARTVFDQPAFRDPATRAIIGKQVHSAFKRVFEHLQLRDMELSQSTGELGLFTAPPGYDSPEIMVMPLKDVFSQKGKEGQWAHQHMTQSLKWFKDATHLGALHDYAVRFPGGWNTAMLCRDRARAWPAGSL
jgi:hypothetical protein